MDIMTQDPPRASDIGKELADYRRQIDDIDDRIIDLLMKRIGIVANVGKLKSRSAPGQCPIRAGREAAQLRNIVERFEGSAFPPAAAAALWRIVIGASTSVEAPLKLSVFTPERDNDLFWLAREYFGPTCPAGKQPQVKRVIGDVVDGKANVGIVPMPHGGDTSHWWTSLMERPDVKIFARIPFVQNVAERHMPAALAIACVMPEASGDDRSLLVLEAEHNVSQHRLQTAFANAKMEATWIAVATLSPTSRHHLIEIKGFVMSEHPALQALLANLGGSIVRTSFLGAYAAPVMLAGA